MWLKDLSCFCVWGHINFSFEGGIGKCRTKTFVPVLEEFIPLKQRD